MKISLADIHYTFDHANKTFLTSEASVRFATSYEVLNPKTGNEMTFDFSHSTGPEFDPNTVWVYTNAKGISFHVSNDPKITKELKQNYLRAKTLNS